MSYSKSVQDLIRLFSKLPSVGPRTAARFTFYLLKRPKHEIENLSQALLNLKKNIRQCSSCFNYFEPERNEEKCKICLDSNRNKSVLCVVEKEADLKAIEDMNQYRGLYFVLGGTISVLNKSTKRIRDQELKEYIKNNSDLKEVIIAINPTTEGKATTLYLEKILQPFNIKITHLARGLPVGGELEYADQETLYSAFKGRK
jgi:recombination protein RecR